MSKKQNKNKVPTYNFTVQQIEATYMKGYNKGRQDSIEKASQYSMAVPIMVLRDEFGFGQKRLDKFLEAYMELFNSIEEGWLDLDDIVETINEETSVTIVKR